jgi:exopolysaccharide biosynthesis operon protein EpsL
MLSSSRKLIDSPWISSLTPARPGGRTVLALLIGSLVAGRAGAAISDTIQPFAALAYSYEDNLLRLPDDAPTLYGRSDSLTQLQAGFALDRPIGQQELTAQAKLSKVTFDHYDQLNYTGKDLSAALQWHLLTHVDGHVGGGYSQTLTPFTDFHSSELNLRTTRNEYADANWRFHPSWQVHAGYTRYQFSYGLPIEDINNRTEATSEVGIDYLTPDGSRIGLVARRLTGIYNNPQVFDGLALDDGYHQNEVKANVYWNLTGTTQLQALVGWARREHNVFTDRDTSGLDGRITAMWQPLGRVKFTLAAWREFAAVESILVNNSLNKGESLGATWEATAKIKVDASVKHESRDFSEATGVVLPGDAKDSGHNLNLGLTYSALQSVQLGVSAYREVRSGNGIIDSGSYTANGMSVSITGQF